MINAREIRTLLSARGAPRVSVYVPMHVAGADIRENPIRFQNQLRDAAKDLEEQGMEPEERERLLAPGRRLVEERDFWRHQTKGLAAFLADGEIRTHRLPASVDPLWATGERYHMKPLLPFLGRDTSYFVLALDLEDTRLFHASEDGLEPVDLGDTPTSLVEAVGGDPRDKALQHHAGGTGAGGQTPALFHGQGSGKDDNKVEVTKFLRRLDDGVTDKARGRLVLAGVEYVVSIYRSITDHKQVHEKAIEGSPARVPAKELHAKAHAIVEPERDGAHDAAAREYEARRAKDAARTDHELESTLLRALDGQVETLFVPADEFAWGRFDAGARRVETHAKRGPGDEDLYDRAAVETVERGGAVHVVPKAELPGDGPVAAILRYAG